MMPEAVFLILVLILMNIGQYIVHYRERKDLYNRMMSRDINEYKTLHQEKRPPPTTGHQRVMAKWRKSPGGEDA